MFKHRGVFKLKHDNEDSSARTETRDSIGAVKAGLIGVAGAGLLAVALVAWTWVAAGRSPAERAATSLAMPTALLWLLAFAATLASFSRKRYLIATLSLSMWLLIGVTYNHVVARAFLKTLELPEIREPLEELASREIDTPLDAIVVLGGYAGDNRYGVAELSDDGQRLFLAARLWHLGKTKTLICTGTAAEGHRDPSVIGRELLVSVGVPDDVIFETPGQNTAGEMVGLRAFFGNPPVSWLERIGPSPHIHETGFSTAGRTVGLVTTSVHLSRAVRLATGQELEFIPLGCRFPGAPDGRFSPRDLIPSASGGRTFGVAFKEWLAKLVGR